MINDGGPAVITAVRLCVVICHSWTVIPADRVRNTEPQQPISHFINPIVFALAAPVFRPHLCWVQCIYSWLLDPGRFEATRSLFSATRRRFGAFTKPAS